MQSRNIFLMTWEMPDKTWKRFLSPTILLGVTAFVLLFKFFSGGEPTQASYKSSCNEQGGEWLLNAVRPTCVFPGGRLVVLDEAQDAPAAAPNPPVGRVVATDDTPGGPETSCILGDWITFNDELSAETYTGRPHRPDFSTYPEAAKYRTAITKDVARGVNVAGAYVLSAWGQPKNAAGQSLMGFAIVDARDGKIMQYGLSGLEVTNIDFRKNSRLVRVESTVGQFPLLISAGAVTQCGRY
jgi:hypothetical protein